MSVRKILLKCLTFGMASIVVGCGPKAPMLNTQPLTEEQKAAIRAEDARIDEEESPGNRTRQMNNKGKR